MIDYIMVGALILVLLLNFAGTVWSTHRNNKQQDIQSGAIYCLYQELHRYNDNQFGKEVSSVEPTATQGERP